jgi:hypothetical protein
MDAYVQVALIEKARRIFGNEDTFLSFPLLSPIIFSPQQIAALNAPGSREDYSCASDFSRIVNFIPKDMVASFDGEETLWDIYDSVLKTADVAVAQQVVTIDDSAKNLLYDTDNDGTSMESKAYRTYRQYRDAWIVAQENYKARQLTAEASGDQTVIDTWRTETEPTLRAAVKATQDAWETTGRRVDIEAALAKYSRVATLNPGKIWQDWAATFNRDIDLVTDAASGFQFAPTGFSPVDLSAEEAWLNFEVSGAEIDQLVGAAPDELKNVLDGGGNGYDKVSFDYRSVSISRAWFRSAVFSSRIWRDPGGVGLCDGSQPPNGRCPAYVSAVVFIKNLQMTPKATNAQTSVPDIRFTIPAEKMTRRTLKIDKEFLSRMEVAPQLRELQPQQQETFVLKPEAMRKLTRQTFVMSDLAAEQPSLITPMVLATRPGPTISTRMRPVDLNVEVARRPRWHRPRFPVPEPGPAPTPPQVETTTNVSVLAFICKRLPKSPDPMPGLQWS